MRIEHLSDAEKRAYILADNKLAEKAGWDREILAIELQALVDMDFEIESTGDRRRYTRGGIYWRRIVDRRMIRSAPTRRSSWTGRDLP